MLTSESRSKYALSIDSTKLAKT